MDVINQVNGTLNQGLDVVNNNRIASTVLGLFLALYASLAAPNLPSSVTVIFKNNWFRLAFMFLIAFMATKDTSLAIITSVALLVTLLTLSAQETTNTVVKAVETKINANIEKFTAVPALSTSDYDQLEDYSLSNSDDRIYMGSGTVSTPDLISSQKLSESNLTGFNQAIEEKKALEAKNYVFRGQLGGDTYTIMGEHNTGSVVNTIQAAAKMDKPKMDKPKMDQPKMNQPKTDLLKMELPKMELPKMIVPKMDQVKMEQARMEQVKMEQARMKVPKMKAVEVDTDEEEEENAPSLLDLITGFENVNADADENEVLPFSGNTHYDVHFNESQVNKSSHDHNVRETFQDEPELPSSCGADAGLAVPGFDLGEFAQFQL